MVANHHSTILRHPINKAKITHLFITHKLCLTKTLHYHTYLAHQPYTLGIFESLKPLLVANTHLSRC